MLQVIEEEDDGETNNVFRLNNCHNRLTFSVDKHMLQQTHQEYTCLFQVKPYLDELWDSYQGDALKIHRQFEVDFPRTDVFLNGSKVKDFVTCCRFISKINRIINHNVLFMLCNQSSFELPFRLMFQLYGNEAQNTFVVSSKRRCSVSICYHNNASLTSMWSVNTIAKRSKSSQTNNAIDYTLELQVLVMNIEQNKCIHTIDITLFLSLELSLVALLSLNTSATGIMSWKIDPIKKDAC